MILEAIENDCSYVEREMPREINFCQQKNHLNLV